MSTLYTDVEMGTSSGIRGYELGGSAVNDVESKLAGAGLFSVWITVDWWDSLLVGTATVPGWDAGGPDLLVTWRDPSAVEAVSWGIFKSLFSP